MNSSILRIAGAGKALAMFQYLSALAALAACLFLAGTADAAGSDRALKDDRESEKLLEHGERRQLGVGLALAFTAEPHEGHTDVSINSLPLFVEYAFSRYLGARVGSTLNYQFAGGERGLAHRGAWMTIPFYLLPSQAPLEGWYLGPHVSFAVNPLLEQASDLIMAAEGGPRFRLFDHWSFNLAMQLGVTRLEEAGGVRFVNHLGLFPSISYWPL